MEVKPPAKFKVAGGVRMPAKLRLEGLCRVLLSQDASMGSTSMSLARAGGERIANGDCSSTKEERVVNGEGATLPGGRAGAPFVASAKSGGGLRLPNMPTASTAGRVPVACNKEHSAWHERDGNLWPRGGRHTAVWHTIVRL